MYGGCSADCTQEPTGLGKPQNSHPLVWYRLLGQFRGISTYWVTTQTYTLTHEAN